MTEVRLKKGKEKAVKQMHPWIFSGAIESVKGKPENGEIVTLVDSTGDFLAKGFFNNQSRVAIRLLSWEDVEISEEWWRSKVSKSVKARIPISKFPDTSVYRLVFSEADYLPGLIVDKYGDFLSLQIHNSGIEKVKGIILNELENCVNPKGIFERSDASARAHEGLESSSGLLSGILPPDFVEVKENGIKYLINISEGQKSGFFCDQRVNRRLVAEHAEGKSVLDCFSYSGGFTLNCLQMGADSVTSIDSSALAIDTLKKNIKLNGFDESKQTSYQADVNKQLRAFRENESQFDIVVLDPPKYAPTRSSLERASRAYKDLNRMGLSLLSSGGLLATFSCSGAVDLNHFKQILAWAALDAGKEIQYIYQFCQPEDHPIRASFPEGEYLKGLLCRVV